MAEQATKQEEKLTPEEIKYNKLLTRYNNLKETNDELTKSNESLTESVERMTRELDGKDLILRQISQEQMDLGLALNQKNDAFVALHKTVMNLLAGVLSIADLSKEQAEAVYQKFVNQDAAVKSKIRGDQ